GHLEFAAPVDHRALRQHQHIEAIERGLEILDRFSIADVELRVIEATELRSLARRIVGGGSAGAADLHARALGPERLRDAVADAAGAADHQNLLAAEIPEKKRMSDFKQLSRSVAGLTVLVTGAASGIGRATARVFAAEGASVAVTDYSAAGAHAVAAEVAARSGTAKAWTLDVANRDDINTVVNEIAAHFGGLDVVINNAGISVATPIDGDGYDAAWDR